jgi:polyamine oxidase
MRATEEIVELATLPAIQQAEFGRRLAHWHVEEFGHLYPHEVWNEQIAVTEFAAMSTPGLLPTTWVALGANGDLVGSVSLIGTDDLPGYDDVGPWLASLFVAPPARGSGLGDRLVQQVLQAARVAGHDQVYLFTSGQTDYYRSRGWRVVGSAIAQSHRADVMVRRTAATAARRAAASAWVGNLDVAGAYSYIRKGSHPSVRHTLAGPILPGMWFAGEHTSAAHPATMHGAWFSGLRAAEQVTPRAGERALVIGAGLAGLAAARALHYAGAAVTVVEASDHLGGRAAIDTSLGIPLPLGGAWLHGVEGHPLRPLVRHVADNGFALAPTFVEGVGRLDDAEVAAAQARLSRVLEQLPSSEESASVAAEVAELAELHDDVSRAFLTLYMENLYAAPMGDASARHVLEDYELPGGDHFITSSLQPVFLHLATGLDVRLGHRISSLTRTADCWTSDTGLTAEHVVVTVPIGALRAGRVRFDPPLPEHVRAAIDGLGAGPVCKLFVTYDERWWPQQSRAFRVIAPGSPLGVSVAADISDLTGVPTLCWFAVGDAASLVEAMSEDERCRLVDDLAERCRIA